MRPRHPSQSSQYIHRIFVSEPKRISEAEREQCTRETDTNRETKAENRPWALKARPPTLERPFVDSLINVDIHIKFVRRRSLQFDYLLMRYDIFIVFRFRFLGDLYYDSMRKLTSERQQMLTMEDGNTHCTRNLCTNSTVRCSTWS